VGSPRSQGFSVAIAALSLFVECCTSVQIVPPGDHHAAAIKASTRLSMPDNQHRDSLVMLVLVLPLSSEVRLLFLGFLSPSIEELDGTNYDTWASNIKLYLKS